MNKPSYNIRVYNDLFGWLAVATLGRGASVTYEEAKAFGFTQKQALRRLNKKLDRRNERPGHPLLQDTEKDYSKEDVEATNYIFEGRNRDVEERPVTVQMRQKGTDNTTDVIEATGAYTDETENVLVWRGQRYLRLKDQSPWQFPYPSHLDMQARHTEREKPATNIFDQKGNEIPELAKWLKTYYQSIYPGTEPLVARTLGGFNVQGRTGEANWTLSLEEVREMKAAHDLMSAEQKAENDMAAKLDSYFVSLYPTEGVGVFRLPEGYRVEIGEGMIVEFNDEGAEALVASTDDFPDANDPDLAEKVTVFTTNPIPKDEPTEDPRRQLSDVTVEEFFEPGGLLDAFLDERQRRHNIESLKLQDEIDRRGLYRQ